MRHHLFALCVLGLLVCAGEASAQSRLFRRGRGAPPPPPPAPMMFLPDGSGSTVVPGTSVSMYPPATGTGVVQAGATTTGPASSGVVPATGTTTGTGTSGVTQAGATTGAPVAGERIGGPAGAPVSTYPGGPVMMAGGPIYNGPPVTTTERRRLFGRRR